MLPLTAPVPKEYAEKFDKNKPSNYAAYEVATGPYMLKNDAEGKVLGVGYIPGKSATLVRNPNWNPKTDYRPAYLNEIDVKIGGTSAVIGRAGARRHQRRPERIGGRPVDRQGSRPKSTSRSWRSRPARASHYIGVNNKVGPFKNIDLRKALWAALDRTAMDKARGRHARHHRRDRTSSTRRSTASNRPVA